MHQEDEEELWDDHGHGEEWEECEESELGGLGEEGLFEDWTKIGQI